MESRNLKKLPPTRHPLLVSRSEARPFSEEAQQSVSFTYTALAALAPAVLLGLIMVIASSVAFNV